MIPTIVSICNTNAEHIDAVLLIMGAIKRLKS